MGAMNGENRPVNSESSQPARTPFDAAVDAVPRDLSAADITPEAATLPPGVELPESWQKPAKNVWRDDADTATGFERSTLFNGCLLGLASNVLLGYFVLMLQRAGLNVYGPGLVAMVVGGGALALALGNWSRRSQTFWSAVLGGLIIGFALIWLAIRPLFQAVLPENSSGGNVPMVPVPPSRPADGSNPDS
jgi:hypothetical protein